MTLNPIETTRSVSDRYKAYLSTAFNLKSPELKDLFMKELQNREFVKGPFIEATPPFVTRKTIKELINDGSLSSEFKKLNDGLPLDRPLYKHQEDAIYKLNKDKRNIVVATGTGSGKTEIFMITILNHLFKQKEKSELSHGVRALLLYPMNALVNDQLARMRTLLENYPEITFGCYTGETEEKQKSAEENYIKIYNREPLKNELISREKMRESPPHILLTNYTMLEYLLLRPNDNVFFDGQYAKNWKFIVIDEVHTYNGAKGIEIAMLLRRLKDRVVKSEPRKIQCIATSATLGKGKEDAEEVSDFAKKLFGEFFEIDDIIEATRKKLPQSTDELSPSYLLYEEWHEIIKSNKGIPALIDSGKKYGIPEHILKNTSNEQSLFLYNVLSKDKNINLVKSLLENSPESLDKISKKVFPDIPNSKNVLVALIELAVKAKHDKDELPLIPAKYHLFIRAVEGAFLSLYPKKKICLQRHESIKINDKEYPVFEMATCRQCGSVYLVGETENDVFKQTGKKYFDNPNTLEYYLLYDKDDEILPENEDELLEKNIKESKEKYNLCSICGKIDKSNLTSPLCDCGTKNYFKLLKVSTDSGKIHKCPACAKTNTKSSIVWRFLLGKDAIASVLVTSLYEQIPEKKLKNNVNKKDDGWTSIKNTNDSSSKRQLLIFSDSRQDAAYFAPYLSRTYSQILRRNLILKTIDENKNDILRNKWRIQDLVTPLKNQIRQVFPNKSLQECENDAYKWIIFELLSIDSKIGLDGVGLLGFSLVKPDNWTPPNKLTEHLSNLSESEVWTLYQILYDGFRKNGAILFPDQVKPKDDFFKPKNHESYFREFDSSYHISSWNPSENHKNTRSDFIERLIQKTQINLPYSEQKELLGKFWKITSEWKDYFSFEYLKTEGTVYRIKHNVWELQPSTINKNIQWYYCDKCNNLTLYNLKDVCPTYRCDGKLQKCIPDEIFKDNHYRALYLNIKPIGMRVEEHTAQLTSRTASEYQREFINGDINILSCSTTFELGVDIGELESVFMRNVPPSPANYIQRAGRAGRRTESTAFVLTFCQRSSHDLTHFNEPKRLVSGKIKPPHFEILNEKIILRHIYATAISKFWKENKDLFGNVETFFLNNNGKERFENYLKHRPCDLYDALKKIVPDALHENNEINLKEWKWVSGLYDKEKGVLQKTDEEVKTDIKNLEELRKTKFEEGKPSDYIKWVINTIKSKELIGFLSNHNVIPKYGFPVDVVELQISHHSEEAKQIELNRDLRIALSEYAPGSEIIANKRLWTSRYLKKQPNKELLEYRYAICDNCNLYHRSTPNVDNIPEICNACKAPLKNKKKYIVPEFGFITSNDAPVEPGDDGRTKTYSTRIYYTGKSDKYNDLDIKLKTNIHLYAESASHSKMVIINPGRSGFKICSWCGYGAFGNENIKTHKSQWNKDCKGIFKNYHLGHEFMTDILQLRFEGYSQEIGFWYSLLYALLEGASEALDIERNDLDGCLFPYSRDPNTQAIILFDDVPGGAGHVRRIAKDEDTIKSVLKSAYDRMKNCDCGGEEGNTSCYGCLRNYRNQFCHDELNRSKVINFLENIIK